MPKFAAIPCQLRGDSKHLNECQCDKHYVWFFWSNGIVQITLKWFNWVKFKWNLSAELFLVITFPRKNPFENSFLHLKMMSEQITFIFAVFRSKTCFNFYGFGIWSGKQITIRFLSLCCEPLCEKSNMKTAYMYTRWRRRQKQQHNFTATRLHLIFRSTLNMYKVWRKRFPLACSKYTNLNDF